MLAMELSTEADAVLPGEPAPRVATAEEVTATDVAALSTLLDDEDATAELEGLDAEMTELALDAIDEATEDATEEATDEAAEETTEEAAVEVAATTVEPEDDAVVEDATVEEEDVEDAVQVKSYRGVVSSVTPKLGDAPV